LALALSIRPAYSAQVSRCEWSARIVSGLGRPPRGDPLQGAYQAGNDDREENRYAPDIPWAVVELRCSGIVLSAPDQLRFTIWSLTMVVIFCAVSADESQLIDS
jgi:hypothetical protein